MISSSFGLVDYEQRERQSALQDVVLERLFLRDGREIIEADWGCRADEKGIWRSAYHYHGLSSYIGLLSIKQS